jgi:hypothetical protein
MPSFNNGAISCAKRVLVRHNVSSIIPSEEVASCDFSFPLNEIDLFLSNISERSGAGLIDPRNLLCSEDYKCSVFVDGIPVYKDWGHITPYGARLLQDKFNFGQQVLSAAK